MHSNRRRVAEALPIVLAFVLSACGGSETVETTTSSNATATTTTPEATTATEAPATTAPAAAATGDLATQLKGGTYLVGSEMLPGPWVADECGCAWAIVDENGTEILGTGDDALVPEDAYAVRLGGCTWTWDG